MRVFLSYARDEDPAFINELRNSLAANGISVWWDQESMHGRGLGFLHEIREAIQDAERVVVVLGPLALVSEYVSAEWQYSLRTCKVVNPILRKSVDSELPSQLSSLDIVDFREHVAFDTALRHLVRQLLEPPAPLGALWDVPELPPHYAYIEGYSRPAKMKLLLRRVEIGDGPFDARIWVTTLNLSHKRTATCIIAPACTRTRSWTCAK